MTKQETSDPQDTRDTPEEHSLEQESENLPIGKLLRQVREKKALTIHDISQETNISSSNLTSIELGNYNELPADTFIRGQIIIYAKFLGIDGPEAARLFFEERTLCLTNREKSPFNSHGKGLSTKQLAEPAHISSATWAVSLLLLIITFIAFFSWYTNWNPFAYFFGQEPAPISTAATAVTHPTTTPDQGGPDTETVTPLVMEPTPAATAQEKVEGADSDTVEQDTSSE
ncbi:MAG: helix-turn-helix domain-containing protein [Candidatus Electrothrix sp.]